MSTLRGLQHESHDSWATAVDIGHGGSPLPINGSWASRAAGFASKICYSASESIQMKCAANQRLQKQISNFDWQYPKIPLFSKNIALPRVILWDFDLATRRAPCLRWQLVKWRVTWVALGIEDRRTQVWRKLVFRGFVWVFSVAVLSDPRVSLIKAISNGRVPVFICSYAPSLIRFLAFWN